MSRVSQHKLARTEILCINMEPTSWNLQPVFVVSVPLETKQQCIHLTWICFASKPVSCGQGQQITADHIVIHSPRVVHCKLRGICPWWNHVKSALSIKPLTMMLILDEATAFIFDGC